MMKTLKPLLILSAGLAVAALIVAALLYNDRDRPLTVLELPVAAQQFLDEHFAHNEVAYATVETDWFDKEYKVVFVDGSKVEFNRRGEWREIECKYGKVADSMIPEPIRAELARLYGEYEIIGIERDRREYEVKLSNRLEVTFDRQFRILDID